MEQAPEPRPGHPVAGRASPSGPRRGALDANRVPPIEPVGGTSSPPSSSAQPSPMGFTGLRPDEAAEQSRRLRNRLDREYVWLSAPPELSELEGLLCAVDPNCDVVMDMSALDGPGRGGDGAGDLVSILQHAQERLASVGGSLVISNPTPDVRQLLNAVGMRRIIRRRS